MNQKIELLAKQPSEYIAPVRGIRTQQVCAQVLFSLISIGMLLFSFNIIIPRWEVLWLYDSKRLFICGLVILSCLMHLLIPAVRSQTSSMLFGLTKPTQIGLGVLFGAMFYANTFGEQFLAAYIQFFYFLGLVMLAALLGPYLAKNKPQFFRLCATINILLFLSVAVMFWGLVLTGNEITIFSLFGFANPRFMNHLQIWIFLPIAYLAVIEIKRKKKGLWLRLGLVLLFATTFATDARGVTLSMIVGFILVSYIDSPNRTIWLRLLLQSVVLGYLAKYVLLDPVPTYLTSIDSVAKPMMEPVIRTLTSDRTDMWSSLLGTASIFGHGGDQFLCDGYTAGHAHNSFLSVLYHWGIVALLGYLCLIALLVKSLFQVEKGATLIFGITSLSAVTYSFFTGLFVTPLSNVLAACTLGLFWSKIVRSTNNTVSNRVKKLSSIMLTLVATITILLIGYRIDLRVSDYPVFEQEVSYRPQFWMGYNCLSNPQLP